MAYKISETPEILKVDSPEIVLLAFLVLFAVIFAPAFLLIGFGRRLQRN